MGYAARHTGHTCLSWKFEDLWGPWGPREDPGRVNFKTWCWGDYSCLCRIRRWELSGAVVADLNRSHGSRFADSAGETMGSWIPTRPTGWVHNCPCFQSPNYFEICRNMMYQSKTSQHLRFLWISTLKARFSIEIYDIHGIHGNLLPFDHQLVTEVVRLFKIGRYSEGQKTQKFLPFFPLTQNISGRSAAFLEAFGWWTRHCLTVCQPFSSETQLESASTPLWWWFSQVSVVHIGLFVRDWFETQWVMPVMSQKRVSYMWVMCICQLLR